MKACHTVADPGLCEYCARKSLILTSATDIYAPVVYDCDLSSNVFNIKYLTEFKGALLLYCRDAMPKISGERLTDCLSILINQRTYDYDLLA